MGTKSVRSDGCIIFVLTGIAMIVAGVIGTWMGETWPIFTVMLIGFACAVIAGTRR